MKRTVGKAHPTDIFIAMAERRRSNEPVDRTYSQSGCAADRELAMCPFCIATSVWIAAGAVSAGGVSALALAKLWNNKAREREQGGTNDEQ